MTGGGSVFDTFGQSAAIEGRTTHSFELHCDARNPNNLQINWAGNSFHLRNLVSARCSDTLEIEPNPPGASFDTFTGMATGRLNGEQGAGISFRFTDAGEPGVLDTASIAIFDPEGNQVLSIAGPLMHGNHQAHTNY